MTKQEQSVIAAAWTILQESRRVYSPEDVQNFVLVKLYPETLEALEAAFRVLDTAVIMESVTATNARNSAVAIRTTLETE